jgi:hypothetical protein
MTCSISQLHTAGSPRESGARRARTSKQLRGDGNARKDVARYKIHAIVSSDMSIQTDQPIALSPKQVAGQLGVVVQTLQNWRNRRIGPPYYRLVRKIVYYKHEVDEWRDQTKWG